MDERQVQPCGGLGEIKITSECGGKGCGQLMLPWAQPLMCRTVINHSCKEQEGKGKDPLCPLSPFLARGSAGSNRRFLLTAPWAAEPWLHLPPAQGVHHIPASPVS